MSVTLYGANKDIEVKWWTFPGGERGCKIVDPLEIERYKRFAIKCKFQSSDDLIDILMLVDACRNIERRVSLRLEIPYFPYARQDRVCAAGEPFALRVAVQMLKGCDFDEIMIFDPHSDVLEALFPPGLLTVKRQWDLAREVLEPRLTSTALRKETVLVAPDAGALKKIFYLAKSMRLPVITCSKVRDTETGKILGTTVPDIPEGAKNFWVIDDICDGGATFIELAKAFYQRYDNETHQLNLLVTHGIFSRGQDVLKAYYNEVLAINNLEKSA